MDAFLAAIPGTTSILGKRKSFANFADRDAFRFVAQGSAKTFEWLDRAFPA